jgi:D-cysteine desulfhydrase
MGLLGNNAHLPVTGINVRRPRAEQEGNVHKLAVDVANLLNIPEPPRASVTALDEWVGAGYSIPTDSMVEAVRLLASTEGVLLDPVYTGKAMAGLIGLVRRGTFRKDEKVLFLHTGGSPVLYAYQKVLQRE